MSGRERPGALYCAPLCAIMTPEGTLSTSQADEEPGRHSTAPERRLKKIVTGEK